MNLRHIVIPLSLAFALAGCETWKDSPLHSAAVKNDPGQISQLTASNTPVDKTIVNRRTALHYAVANANYEATVALLNAGANPNFQDNRGDTPLMMAASRGLGPIVRVILEKHPILDAQNDNGFTALHFASRDGHADVVEMLVRAGASPDRRNSDGKTPADLATNNRAVLTALGQPPTANPQPAGDKEKPGDYSN